MKVLIFALLASFGLLGSLTSSNAVSVGDRSFSLELARYRLDPAKSTFMVHADRAGFAWFKGHSHRIAAKDFRGEAALTLDALNPASLEMTVNAGSLEETDPIFTAQQKAIINKELDEIVLESAKYPEITFKSTDIKGSIVQGAFDVEIGGDLTLHGVTQHITIPARVTLEGNSLRAVGEFDINRKKFGVNATDAFHGLVKVLHTIKFKFDIIGTRV